MNPINFARYINTFLYAKDYDFVHMLQNDFKIKKIYYGGNKFKNIKYDNEIYKINIEKNYTDNEIEIMLLTMNNIQNCGIILLFPNEKIANINDIHYYENCFDGKIKNGKILMKLMIEIAKKNGANKIYISDRATKLCINKYKFHLKYLYTLLHGYPWYAQFGFIPIEDDNKKIMKYNFNLIKKLKVNDIDNILKKYNINVNNKNIYARYVFRELIKNDCEFFYNIYENICNDIGLKFYKNFSNPLPMILTL